MEEQVAFIQNKYYFDAGMEYVYRRLKEAFAARDTALVSVTDLYASYPQSLPDFRYAVFWDKDAALGYRLEQAGVRLFNRAATVEVCDDKQKTFAALAGKIELPPTVVAPLVYDVSDGTDERFLDFVEMTVRYPAVVKECVGSQGRQVYLAENRRELTDWHNRLMHVPHLFQKFLEGDRGSDIRVFIVGGKAIAAAKRSNTTDFRSNTALGGRMSRIELPDDLRAQAETAAEVLELEYGSTDFMQVKGRYMFIEANSSVYMKNAESIGIPLAETLANYVTEVRHGSAR